MFKYQSPRVIHPRRLLDITWGSVLNSTKTAVQKLKLGSTIRSGVTVSDFNEKIRTASPNIYVVDPQYLADLVVRTYGGTNPENLVTILGNTIKANIRDTITMDTLISIATGIHNKMCLELTTAAEKGKGYISFRKAAAGAGAELRRILNKYPIALIKDPENFIANPSGKFVFMGYSFERVKKEINNVLTNAIKGYAVKNKVKLPIDFKVGDLIDSGHVGLYTDNTFLGINMPAQIIHGTVGKKFEEVEQALGQIDTHIEYGLRINEKFNATGVLLDLGFQFTVVMEGTLNRKLWTTKEQKALLDNVTFATKEELTKVFKDRATEEILVNMTEEYATDIRNSPTIKEFIANSVAGLIQGKPVIPTNSSSSNKGRSANLPKSKESIVKSKKASKSVATIKNKTKPLKAYDSLASLQALLDATLVQRVKQNMNKPALQNRTGRFAESVKVERLSESRAGMITAFYSYMKRPYQTFEPGFKQGSAARDPKSLISKSIREVAATMVGNRLRAVRI